MAGHRMRKFYQHADVRAVCDGVGIVLDQRPVRTPGGAAVIVPSRPLAEAIAAEWRAQGETVLPHTMPLTRLAITAIDRVAPTRGAMIDDVMSFAGTDLLCYRAPEPAELARRQVAHWQPVLDWVALRFGARLATTTTITPVAQSPEALAALRAVLEGYDDLRLTVAGSIAAACGSLVLALAMVEGRLGPGQAFAAGQVDETFQNERWGVDEEAAVRREALRADVHAAADFLALLSAGTGEQR